MLYFSMLANRHVNKKIGSAAQNAKLGKFQRTFRSCQQRSMTGAAVASRSYRPFWQGMSAKPGASEGQVEKKKHARRVKACSSIPRCIPLQGTKARQSGTLKTS
ncbi:unnamed protein product [Ixodes pacificus]